MNDWLSHFPRPPEDNGRGVHGPTSQYPDGLKANWGFWEQEFKELHLRWFKMLDPGDASAIWLAERLIAVGIMPIIRFFREEPNPHPITSREVEAAKQYISIGAVYFETNNEPDLDLEWENKKRPPNWLDIVVRNFIAEADMIRNIGGYLLFPAFGPGGRNNPFEMIVNYGRKDLLDGNCCLAIHNYCLGRPLDYPNDAINTEGVPLTPEEWEEKGGLWAWEMGHETVSEHRRQLANPLADIMLDSTCFRAFEYFDALVNEAVGHSIPIFTTEGGYNVGQRAGTTFGDDPRYPKPTPRHVAELTLEMFKRIEQGPDYYFASMPWYLAGQVIGEGKPYFESQGPWYSFAFRKDFPKDCSDSDGRMPVVFALKDYPGKVRADGPLSEHWGQPLADSIGDIKMANEFDKIIEHFLKGEGPINEASDYGVEIQKVNVGYGRPYFKIIGVYHLKPEENNSRHHLFLEVLNKQGERLRGTKLDWEWSGMAEGERPSPVIIDKPDNETSNIPLHAAFQEVQVWARGLPSERVTGIRSTHPDEGKGNTWGHHSFLVVWQAVVQDESLPLPDPPLPDPEDDEDETQVWKDRLASLLTELDGIIERYGPFVDF